MTPVILASQSASRAAVLAGAGVAFEAAPSGVDEDDLKADLLARGVGPDGIARVLADAKAVAVSATHSGLVIGADQTLDLDGVLYDKASSLAEARERLLIFRARSHKLHAAVTVARDGAVIWRCLQTSNLAMRSFSDAFLDDYLALEGEAILGSVGCYRLEGPGVQLFETIEGDYFAILGLPLLGLLDLLRREGALAA